MAIVPDMAMETLNVPSGNNLPPTISVNAHAGSTATATIIGNNWYGKITIASAGTGQAAGVQASVTFGAAFQRTPFVILMPADATSQGINAEAANPSTTGFDVDSATAPTAASNYIYYFLVLQS